MLWLGMAIAKRLTLVYSAHSYASQCFLTFYALSGLKGSEVVSKQVQGIQLQAKVMAF